MEYPSNLILTNQPGASQEKIFAKEEKDWKVKWYVVVVLAAACLVLMIVYVGVSSESCALYMNGVQNTTLDVNQKDCSSMLLNGTFLIDSNGVIIDVPANSSTMEIRKVKTYPRPNGVLIAFGVCLGVMLLVLIIIFTPCNLGNYRTCGRRITCCCKQTTLSDSINRYMKGYISNEDHFKDAVQSGREGLDMIIDKLKYTIPEVTFNVLITGSIQERLGKPTILKLQDMEVLPIKSLLSSDFDVLLTPQLITASRKEHSVARPTLFEVVTLPNMPIGFVWLKLNQDFQESRNMFWLSLCKEFTFLGGAKEVFLSSIEVRNVFVEGMKKVRKKELGSAHWLKVIYDNTIDFHVRAQGPAVTVTVQSYSSWCCLNLFELFRPILFYGDFIFAIRCIGWPREAEQWPSRQRNWPSPAVIQEVLSYGYHVVPKASSPVDYRKKKAKNTQPRAEEYEWRLSYSLAEIILSKHIPPVARVCFLALKGTIKRHQRSANLKGLSSYHLKTILFWALEKNPCELWCYDRIEECFLTLVDSLLECATTCYCGHYFMPQMNLMAAQPIWLANLRNLLNKIKQDPISYVSSRNLRCLGNMTACIECTCYDHGEDMYIDVY